VKAVSSYLALSEMFGLLLLTALTASVTAHTIFQASLSHVASDVRLTSLFVVQEVYVNGVSQGHQVGVRVPSYDICNGGINPYTTPVSSAVISVAAGATVGAQWHHTLASIPLAPISFSANECTGWSDSR
jgi:hypothetical protein